MTTKVTTQTESVRGFELTYSPKVMAKSKGGVKAEIIEFTTAIHEKTNGEAIFYPTTKVYPKAAPITNIIKNFPSTAAKLDDFFEVIEMKDSYSLRIYFAISVPGLTDMELRASLKNTLKHNNLWLASKEISAKTFDDIGFVENSNPDYTNSKEIEIAIEKSIMELVKTDPEAAAIHSKIKGPKFITCTSKKIYGGKNAVTEVIVIRTTHNNYGLVLRLLSMIPNEIGPHYVIRPKILKKQLNTGGWDRLIQQQQRIVNNQRIMVLMNIDSTFFDIKVNFQRTVANLQSITIGKFFSHNRTSSSY